MCSQNDLSVSKLYILSSHPCETGLGHPVSKLINDRSRWCCYWTPLFTVLFFSCVAMGHWDVKGEENQRPLALRFMTWSGNEWERYPVQHQVRRQDVLQDAT